MERPGEQGHTERDETQPEPREKGGGAGHKLPLKNPPHRPDNRGAGGAVAGARASVGKRQPRRGKRRTRRTKRGGGRK